MKHVVTFRLTTEELKELDALCSDTDSTRARTIRTLLHEYIQRPGEGFTINYHGAVLHSKDGPNVIATVDTNVADWNISHRWLDE